MKLKLFRHSGRPINLDDEKLYEQTFKAIYDACEERSAVVAAKKRGKLQLTPKVMVLQRMLRYAERVLLRKFAAEVEVPLPKTAKAWTQLLASYQDVPVMLARKSAGNGLVLILMDTLDG